MHDGGKIIVGLAIFIILLTFPIWSNLATGQSAGVPDPKLITEETE